MRAQLAETQFGYRRLVESLQEELAFYRARGSGPGGRFPIPRVNASSLTSALYLEHAASGIPLIVEGMEYEGKVVQDKTKSDGQYKKTADNSKFMRLHPGFRFTPMKEGLAEVCKWFKANYDKDEVVRK